MTSRQKAALVSGVAATVAAFVIWLALGDSPGEALVYALIVGIVAGGVTWWQLRNRD